MLSLFFRKSSLSIIKVDGLSLVHEPSFELPSEPYAVTVDGHGRLWIMLESPRILALSWSKPGLSSASFENIKTVENALHDASKPGITSNKLTFLSGSLPA